MNLAMALKLGRISNLPTVWSNVLAATVLSGAPPFTSTIALVAAAVSLLYVGGMYLNDGFDREIDAHERPTRPIPSGAVSANSVFGIGFLLLLAGLGIIALAADTALTRAGVLAGLALAATIVVYNWFHKGNPLSPLLMGLCRVLVYATTAYAVTTDPGGKVFAAATALLGYLIGLTYIAKQEALDHVGRLWPLAFLAAPSAYTMLALEKSLAVWAILSVHVIWIGVALHFLRRRQPGDVPRAVIALITGICIVDALFLAGVGALTAAIVVLACFAMSLVLQYWVSGT